MRHRLLLPIAVLTAVAVAPVAVSVGVPPPARAATVTDTAALASYLTGALTGGDRYEAAGSPDVGLTADGALALAGTRSNNATVTQIATWLSAHAASWFDYAGDPASLASGAVGKTALVAEVAGRDPRAFAGHNLLTLLSDHVCTAATVSSAPDACPAVGAYYNAPSTLSQSLALLAQARAGVPDAAAVSYLLSLQHTDGSFPSLVSESSAHDPDSTSVAIQALSLLPGDAAAVQAVAHGIAFLAGSQNANGSWSSAATDSVNSTGLALQAFHLDTATATTQAAKITAAQAFLAARQNTDGGLPVNDDAGQSGSDVRASAQALGGVTGIPFSTLALPTTIAARPTTTVPAANAAAAFLVQGLTGGDHVELQGYVQAGITADVALGLLASGGQDATLGQIMAFLGQKVNLDSYIDGENFGDPGSAYANAVAKLATVFELAGLDPTSVGSGHVNLITTLQGLQDSAGRLHDRSTFGDYANVFGQSFAVLALTAAGDPAGAGKAKAALIAAQCTDGGFPVSFLSADVTTCASDPDATGLAAQALNAAPAGTGASAPGAQLVAAVTWLRSHANADGSFSSAATVNVNSTGYAGMGLLAAGADATATAAFLARVANPDGGLPVTPPGMSDLFATAQALPVLAGKSFLQLTPAVLTTASTVPTPTPTPTTSTPTPSTPTPSTPTTSTPAPTTSAPIAGATAGSHRPAGGRQPTGAGHGGLAATGLDVIGQLGNAGLALLVVGVGCALTAWGVRRRRALPRHLE